jgi:uncharacterized protein YkwD
VSRRPPRRRTAVANARRLATVALIGLVAATPPAVGADRIHTTPRRATAALSRYERDLLHVVNAMRVGSGRASLTVSAELTEAAELHTARMIRRGFFDHEAPGEPAFWHRIERFYPSDGYGYWAVGENLAYGSPRLDPSEALREWMLSASHRRSLLSRAWREVGVAAVHVEAAPGEFEGEPTTVITLDLGARRESKPAR